MPNMVEFIETMDGKTAYKIAMENLKTTCYFPWFLAEDFPDRYFHYGEGGRGLILSHHLVYVSSECAEDIREVDGPPIKDSDNYLKKPKFKWLYGKLPSDAIKDVLEFTTEVKQKTQAHQQQNF